MAKAGATANPASLLGDATRYADLRQRLLFLIGALIMVYNLRRTVLSEERAETPLPMSPAGARA